MHRISDAASSTEFLTPWVARLLKVAICLGCLAAGAALVAVGTPRTRLSAAGGAPARGSGDTVLLDFTAKWCGPCQEMSPIVDRLAQQGYPVRKVDVDQQRDIAERFGIKSMPTFVLLVSGREVMRQEGATSESQLRRMLLQIPNWEREFAAQDARNAKGQQLATTAATTPDSDFGPSPFQIDLGQSTRAPAVARAEPPKRGFGLPFFNRTSEPARTTPDADTAIVRGQSSETESVNTTALAGDAMQASTRLRVKDSEGVNFGSGTIVESRIGRTLILTCGHIFEHLGENGVVEVDIFIRGRQPQTYVGKLVRFDEEADIGLVAIPTTERLPSVNLGSIDAPLLVGDSLSSIGCGGGEVPRRDPVEVTSLNKYTGPDNIECTLFPDKGRSGGGLFRGSELVGVCIAADPKDQRGVYTALTPVYELLEVSGFGHLLPVGRPAVVPEVADTSTAPGVTAAVTESPFGEELPARLPSDVDMGSMMADAALLQAGAANLSNVNSSEDLHNVLGQAPDSEIICIVRPKNPGVPSRVVIIHEATPKLVGYLLDSVGQPAPGTRAISSNSPPANTLIPTTAVESAWPSPFEGAASMESGPKPYSKPLRPTSPR